MALARALGAASRFPGSRPERLFDWAAPELYPLSCAGNLVTKCFSKFHKALRQINQTQGGMRGPPGYLTWAGAVLKD